MLTTATEATPQIISPKEPQDFSKPFTIRWDPMGTPNVTGWWLCIGTMGVEEGLWNIFSGDVGLNRKTTIDLSDWPNLNGISAQLLCAVQDKELDTGERTMVLEPIVIKSIYDKSAMS
mgnify:CR=1 FL=1